MQPIKYLLGELLFLSNSSPVWWREEFYRIKDHILKTHADLEGHHLQHIFKECYGCNGSGKVMKEVRMLGEWIRMPVGRCPKCHGSRKYDEFWTVLASYRLGKRQFHRPVRKYYSQATVPHMEFRELIEGYISHQHPKYYLGNEAALWLALFFDRKAFFRRFGNSGCSSRKFTPMVILGTWIFDIKMFGKRVVFKIHDVRNNMKEFRQDLCKHEFQKDDYPSAWDHCEHCDIERIYATDGRDEVPF